jgi:uncharacterized membrane protein YgcG
MLALLGAFFWIWDFDDGTAYADVRDTTGTFSEEAVRQANKVIEEIHQKYGKEVVVEVLPSAGGQSYSQLVNSRAQQANVNGVYVLITRNPGHVEVWVHNDAARAFPAQDRDQLRDRFVAQFRNRQFDQGLTGGVDFIRQSFFANLGPRSGQPNYNHQQPAGGGGGSAGVPAPQQRRSSGISWFWWLIIIGLGLFLLMRFMRRRQQAYSPGYGSMPGQPANYGGREPYHGQQYPGGATGAGGWGRGMLGGLMGGMAGGWLYDKMRGGGGAAGGGTAYGDQGDAGGGAFGGTSSGGDFDSGGGGDFGGGGGGGESSGGDF